MGNPQKDNFHKTVFCLTDATFFDIRKVNLIRTRKKHDGVIMKWVFQKDRISRLQGIKYPFGAFLS
jgi:hypothetical protein